MLRAAHLRTFGPHTLPCACVPPFTHLDHEVCYYHRMTLRSAFKVAAGVALALLTGVTGSGQSTSPAELKVGDTAPPFNLQGSDGKTYQLADFKGKSAVVLAWFPKAFTGG